MGTKWTRNIQINSAFFFCFCLRVNACTPTVLYVRLRMCVRVCIIIIIINVLRANNCHDCHVDAGLSREPNGAVPKMRKENASRHFWDFCLAENGVCQKRRTGPFSSKAAPAFAKLKDLIWRISQLGF